MAHSIAEITRMTIGTEKSKTFYRFSIQRTMNN